MWNYVWTLFETAILVLQRGEGARESSILSDIINEWPLKLKSLILGYRPVFTAIVKPVCTGPVLQKKAKHYSDKNKLTANQNKKNNQYLEKVWVYFRFFLIFIFRVRFKNIIVSYNANRCVKFFLRLKFMFPVCISVDYHYYWLKQYRF